MPSSAGKKKKDRPARQLSLEKERSGILAQPCVNIAPRLAYQALQKFLVFFFNDTATPEIYTLSLHDALPTSALSPAASVFERRSRSVPPTSKVCGAPGRRSEEHTSELQSRRDLVCRLLL